MRLKAFTLLRFFQNNSLPVLAGTSPANNLIYMTKAPHADISFIKTAIPDTGG